MVGKMGQTRSTCEGKGEIHKEFFVTNLEETDHMEDTRRIREDNIKMYILKTRGNGVQWVNLPVDRDKWQALVHTVTDQFRIPKIREIF
jgi:hypothetical protein